MALIVENANIFMKIKYINFIMTPLVNVLKLFQKEQKNLILIFIYYNVRVVIYLMEVLVLLIVMKHALDAQNIQLMKKIKNV